MAKKQEVESCNEVETKNDFTYLTDRVRSGDRYEGVVTARRKCKWVTLR